MVVQLVKCLDEWDRDNRDKSTFRAKFHPQPSGFVRQEAIRKLVDYCPTHAYGLAPAEWVAVLWDQEHHQAIAPPLRVPFSEASMFGTNAEVGQLIAERRKLNRTEFNMEGAR